MIQPSLFAGWVRSTRADPQARPLADRHYNRQKVGHPQFVPPGRCLVLLRHDQSALWVTSFPIAAFVKHAWAGAWVNSLFRNEGQERSSTLIREAVLASRDEWPIPERGIVSFVDPRHVPPTRRRGQDVYGYCYLMAGFTHVGFTKSGLWAWQMSQAQIAALQ